MDQKMKQANHNALLAMILGITGMLLSCVVIGGVIALLGLCYSIYSIRNEDCTKRGQAITGMITSSIGLIIFVVTIFAFLEFRTLRHTETMEESTQVTVNEITKIK